MPGLAGFPAKALNAVLTLLRLLTPRSVWNGPLLAPVYMCVYRMVRFSNPGASTRFFPSIHRGGQSRVDDSQDGFATAERNIDFAVRRDVVWNEVKHLF
jgi:hypothetical protein